MPLVILVSAMPKCPCVYFAAIEERSVVKIGVAVDVARRMKELQVSSPFPLKLLGVIRTPEAPILERSLHTDFAHRRVRGEWFQLSADILAYIKTEARPLRSARIRPRPPTADEEIAMVRREIAEQSTARQRNTSGTSL